MRTRRGGLNTPAQFAPRDRRSLVRQFRASRQM
jgi:hypothetical protein